MGAAPARIMEIVTAMNELPYAEIAGAMEFLFRPKTRESWGGPFNGQALRLSQVREIFGAIKPDVVIETGTYRATSTIALADLSRSPVFTIESSRRYWGYSRMRLLLRKQITLLKGDSRDHIARLGAQLSPVKQVPFFYLDAHWEDDLPLARELELIYSFSWDAVVMIDDFKVEGDDGYTYDDYGPGKVLDMNYLRPAVADHQLDVFFPSAPSTLETGMKRGAVILARKGQVSHRLDQLSTLAKMK
jgi:hypothetical protein